jgi:multidrug efflux pump subunit AcrB
MIRWFANNGIAANFLMVAILLAGLYTAFFRVPLEVVPTRQYNSVYIEMPYRGATAKDVERAILIPIENALQGVEGIEMLHADGMRGRARLYIVAEDGHDPRVLMEDIRNRIDGITTFPSETEEPRIRVPDSSQWTEVLKVAVTGDLPAHELRKVARRVQEELIEIDGISLVNLEGERRYEIAIEADLERLEAYNLGFRDLADAIRRSSIDLPAGAIRSPSGTLTVRTRGQAYTQAGFEKIPIRASGGAELLLGEVATVKDGFEEGDKIVMFNGKPSLFIEVMRTGNESAIDISQKVQQYVDTASARFSEGIRLYVWDDESVRIRGRLTTLTWSLVQGGVLVFVILGLFLRDDAIVTGENVYSKLKTGTDPLEASVQGTKEVAVPVTFGVLTTVVAFLPLLYFEGWWGDFAKQIPPIVAPVLLFSLVESKLILPSHLKHIRVGQIRLGAFGRFQKRFADGLEWVVTHIYKPSLATAARHRATTICLFLASGLLIAGYCRGGRMGFVSLPEVDRPRISAWLDLPDDTTVETTHAHADRIIAAVEQLKKEFVDKGTGKSLILNVMKVSGARHVSSSFDKSRAMVAVELLPPSMRSERGPRNSEIVKRWIELVGPIPGAISFNIRSESLGGNRRRGDYQEEALELELRGPASAEKKEIAERIADYLKSFDGITSTWANVNYGQDELEFTLKPRAMELGLTQQSLAYQIRQAFYGEEAQRILRDTEDIRVMVRLPRKARESVHTLDLLRVRTPAGAEVPLFTVADVTFVKSPTFIERNDRAKVIRIGGMPEDETVDIIRIAKEATPVIQEMVDEQSDLSFVFRGYIAGHAESRRRTIIGSGTIIGSVGLLFALFALLAIPFKSLIQPIYVMLAVPFGIIGALVGHILMGITPSYLSVFGMLALAGVAVNDSLVLVDYINRRCREGAALHEAVMEAGPRRFRPIVLTSATTFVGLLPLLMDRSLQAQFLIPMAVSLGAGILFSTVITLYLIPCALLLSDDLSKGFARIRNWYFRPFLARKIEDSVK